MQAIDARLCNGVDEVVVHPRGSHSLGTSNLIVAPSPCVIVQPSWRRFLPFTLVMLPSHILQPQLRVYFLFQRSFKVLISAIILTAVVLCLRYGFGEHGGEKRQHSN